MFATVDLCLLDLATGSAVFSKLAACRSLILREGRVISVEGGRLPLGILEKVRPAETRMELLPGDTLLMFSDGLEDAVGAPGLLESMLLEREGMGPREIAESLLQEAEARRGSRSDDMTAICVRIHSRKDHLQSREKSGIIGTDSRKRFARVPRGARRCG
jgi:serine phosphatase RsbU (regulator of sigma subunit)